MACRQPTEFTLYRPFPLRPEPFSTSNIPAPPPTSDYHTNESQPIWASATLLSVPPVNVSALPMWRKKKDSGRLGELIYARFLFIWVDPRPDNFHAKQATPMLRHGRDATESQAFFHRRIMTINARDKKKPGFASGKNFSS